MFFSMSKKVWYVFRTCLNSFTKYNFFLLLLAVKFAVFYARYTMTGLCLCLATVNQSLKLLCLTIRYESTIIHYIYLKDRNGTVLYSKIIHHASLQSTMPEYIRKKQSKGPAADVWVSSKHLPKIFTKYFILGRAVLERYIISLSSYSLVIIILK